MDVRHAAQEVVIRIQAFRWFLLGTLDFGSFKSGHDRANDGSRYLIL